MIKDNPPAEIDGKKKKIKKIVVFVLLAVMLFGGYPFVPIYDFIIDLRETITKSKQMKEFEKTVLECEKEAEYEMSDYEDFSNDVFQRLIKECVDERNDNPEFNYGIE